MQTRSALLVAASVGVALAADPGALPAAYSSGTYGGNGGTDVNTLWVKDPTRSDGFDRGYAPGLYFQWMDQFFNNDQCTTAQIRTNSCPGGPSWYGAQPAQIRQSNTVQAPQSSAIDLILKPTPGNNFDAANAASDQECGCVYETYTTGLLRSRRLYRGGYTEVRMIHGAEDRSVSSIWFQSDNVEISVAIQGSQIKTSGYFFKGDDTLSSHSVTNAHPGNLAAESYNVYGIEWQANNDIVIHVNGAYLHTLQASQWTIQDGDDSLYLGQHMPSSQQLNLMIDIQIADDADLSTEIPESRVRIDYIQQWEFDCQTQLQVTQVNVGSGPVRSIQGVAGSCDAPGYAQMCNQYDRNFCTNPYGGGAALTHEWDNACELINREPFCGGALDYRQTSFATSNSADDTKGYQKGLGSVGQCQWDFTAGEAGGCMSRAPSRFDPYTIATNLNTCGGPSTNANNQDVTGGYGMWCFNRCTRKTKINKEISGPGSEEVFGWFRFICAGARDAHNRDYCNEFTQDHHEIVERGTTTKRFEVKSSYRQCAAVRDIAGEDPTNRGLSCFVKFGVFCSPTDSNCAVGFQTAGMSSFKIRDYNVDGTPTVHNGATLGGSFCLPRDARETNFQQGGIPPWRFTPYGQAACEGRGNQWGCVTLASGTSRNVCRGPSFSAWETDTALCA